MSEEKDFSIKKLNDAVESLTQGINETKTELGKDGVIQRFEFCFELTRKAFKVFLEDEGFIVKTPKESFSKAFKIGLIRNESAWLEMLKDGNRTSHIYDKETSEAIFHRIQSNYQPLLKEVLSQLSKKQT